MIDRREWLYLRAADVRKKKPSDVPELRDEVPARSERFLEVVRVEHHIGTHAESGDHRVTKSIGAEERANIEWVDSVAQGLRHLHVLHVAHRSVQVHRMERRLSHERESAHDHARHPEKKNLRSGDQIVRGIEGAKILALLVGPSQSRERPEPRREPGVEDVFILSHCRSAFGARIRIITAHGGSRAAVAIPHRYAVPPPQLPRDVPVADVLEPVDVHGFPPRWEEPYAAVANRLKRRLC